VAVISMAPPRTARLVVSSRSRMATRRSAGQAAAQAANNLAACPRRRGNRAGVTWRCGSGDASGGYRLAHHPDRVAQVVEQRLQIPAAPRSGARQELRGGHPRTGERINDRGFKQLRPQLSGTTVTTPVLRWRRPGRGGDVFPRHAERPRTGRVEEADDPRDPSRAHWPTIHRGSVVRRSVGAGGGGRSARMQNAQKRWICAARRPTSQPNIRRQVRR
jgi:hypothetical protein